MKIIEPRPNIITGVNEQVPKEPLFDPNVVEARMDETSARNFLSNEGPLRGMEPDAARIILQFSDDFPDEMITWAQRVCSSHERRRAGSVLPSDYSIKAWPYVGVDGQTYTREELDRFRKEATLDQVRALLGDEQYKERREKSYTIRDGKRYFEPVTNPIRSVENSVDEYIKRRFDDYAWAGSHALELARRLTPEGFHLVGVECGRGMQKIVYEIRPNESGPFRSALDFMPENNKSGGRQYTSDEKIAEYVRSKGIVANIVLYDDGANRGIYVEGTAPGADISAIEAIARKFVGDFGEEYNGGNLETNKKIIAPNGEAIEFNEPI